MVMTIALELGKSEEDIATWKLSEVVRWMAFFRVRSEYMKNTRRNIPEGDNVEIL